LHGLTAAKQPQSLIVYHSKPEQGKRQKHSSDVILKISISLKEAINSFGEIFIQQQNLIITF
jgi:hypothetical protein